VEAAQMEERLKHENADDRQDDRGRRPDNLSRFEAKKTEGEQEEIEGVKIVGCDEVIVVVRETREFFLPRINPLSNQTDAHPLEIVTMVLDGVADSRDKRDKRSDTKRDKDSALHSI